MINTLSIARKLSSSGVKREQAEAIADVVADAVDQQYGELATKDFVRNEISIVRGEISDLRGDMNAQISDLRGDMNAQIGDLRGDMTAQIGDLRSDMNAQIGDLRGDTKAQISGLRGEISALETRLVRWIVATGLVVIGLLVAVVTIF